MELAPARASIFFLYEKLDGDMIQNKCLELMDNCYAKWEMLLWSHRMLDKLWEEIRKTTPWTELVPARVLRTFSLKLAHAAWVYVDNPKRET
ncbi:hypothetical protein C8A00DRAFT_18751 [Chaetomidium leptoderma]|uniref:Uncharacterized protein n=1 Tax=Chaetomidium leptoderma TaxID=669021 RepID=A0AAN6VG73_9PEZI|nr:hypothetical protein C8A00DRAFT_18751 [Chaetomidium leptoderma]